VGEGALVSVIVPSFNQGRYIRETIDSCLQQDYGRLEVLVVDGASTDETVPVLESFGDPRLRWRSEPDKGVADAVNKGLARAQGDFLTIQSSDDLFRPGAISAAAGRLAANPSLGLVYGDVEYIDAQSRVTGASRISDFSMAEYVGRFSYIPQPGTVFTRRALEAVGGWRDAYSYAADADFWMRIAMRFPVGRLDRFVARYRYHPEQRDTQRSAIARDWAGAVGDLLATGGLSARERRFARMGIHLANYRYAPEGAWVLRTRELYAALLANPVGVLDGRFPRRELLPGRTPIWARLSRMKRAVGFRPRTS